LGKKGGRRGKRNLIFDPTCLVRSEIAQPRTDVSREKEKKKKRGEKKKVTEVHTPGGRKNVTGHRRAPHSLLFFINLSTRVPKHYDHSQEKKKKRKRGKKSQTGNTTEKREGKRERSGQPSSSSPRLSKTSVSLYTAHCRLVFPKRRKKKKRGRGKKRG